MKQIMLTLAIVLFPFLCKGQTNDTAFDFEKAEQLLETLMQQDISDADAQEQVCAIACMVGFKQYVEHRYDAAIRTLDYSIRHSSRPSEPIQILNRALLISSMCVTHDRNVLHRLQEIRSILLEYQSDTMRGHFPVEYADGMRECMNGFLLPLTSQVAKTFCDEEALSICFNTMLSLKEFAFRQLGNRVGADIKHSLNEDYRKLISSKLHQGEVAIELVPYMNIDGGKVRSTNYVAYILDHNGHLQFADVCAKGDIEALYRDNDAPWQLYAGSPSRLSSLVWNKLRPFVEGKRRIYLSPCGVLNRVNFILLDERVRELSNMCQLLKTYPESSQHGALLVGDVDYDQVLASEMRGNRDWGKLSGTKREIESVAKSLKPRYNVTMLTNSKATESAVRQLFGRCPAIIHIASHAICYTDSLHRSQYDFFKFPYDYYPEKPELTFTGLVLAGGNMGFKLSGNRELSDDGILLSEEISKLSLGGTALVVLSVCNSANGIFDDIEGALGLVKSFKLAGAKTIIASLSRVDDDVTSEFMAEFYSRQSQGEDLHTAFVNTVRHFKALYPDQPKYWAAFKMIDCF